MTHQKKQPINAFRLLKRPWLCAFLMIALMPAARAADALYENDAVVNVNIPTDLFQIPDATNFVNKNWFELNFVSTLGSETFEAEDTINYTNLGTMVTEGPLSVPGLQVKPGCGFIFDTYNTQSGLEYQAGSFYNAGSIRANSVIDLGTIVTVGAFPIEAYTVGQSLINATNIVNPGTLDIGQNGLMQLTGQNIDLTRGTLALETGNSDLYGTGSFGLDTNKDWNPGVDLGSTFALSSLPFQIYLPDSTSYFNFAYSNGGTNVVIRSAFVEDFSTPTVPINVYFDSAGIFGGGNVTVEWIAAYTNYATGLPITNYLYLNNDYVLGASTNVLLTGTPPGYPDNFVFTESTTELSPGTQASPAFFNVYPNENISNVYAYVTANLISTTVSTNSAILDPNGAITNLPGQIKINASKELKMGYTTISQPNYMSLTSTNQFDGSIGAAVASPFSDINLGVTNGFLTISNLLTPYVPVWSGTIDAWSTDFLVTNGVGGTNDNRVLIVGSTGLNPVSPAYIQNLKLHSTNLVVSDTLNVLSKLSIDAQNLTLTTNPIANGATSPAGELIWANNSILFSNSLPNLKNLTNNGVIQCPNLISLGQASPLNAIINNGGISDGGTAFWATNFLSSGNIVDGTGSFQLNASTVTLTNGSIIAASNNISITANTIEASNVVFDAGSALILAVTNLSDGFPNGTTGLTNANNWSIGTYAFSGLAGLYGQNGLNLLLKSSGSGLLGTTITSVAPTNKLINNLWAAQDYGASNSGYTNNAAIGQLILNAQSPGPGTQFYFSGAGTSNAIYVDHLVLNGYASYLYHSGTNSLPAVVINTNLVIYYADATASGVGDVSFLLNGFNGNHLRWVPTYVGYFSATNIVYPNGSTNALNVGLVDSPFIDSNGNGSGNSSDPTPLFVTSQLNFTDYQTNNPPNTVVISWNSVPLATNFVYYSTNLLNWQLLTNAYLMTNPFVSPEPYPGPITNITVLDSVMSPGRFYQVVVSPDLLNP